MKPESQEYQARVRSDALRTLRREPTARSARVRRERPHAERGYDQGSQRVLSRTSTRA